jgi:hypothetical protein
MSITRKLFVLAAMVVAAFAFAAPSAFAQSVEGVNEDTGLHCGDVEVADHGVSGDCEVVAHDILSSHLGGTQGVLLSRAGMPLSLCHNEFEGYLGEDASGIITHQSLTNTPDSFCFVEPCREADEHFEPWPIISITEPGIEQETMRVAFCVVPLGTPHGGHPAGPCVIDVDIIELGNHDYRFEAEDSPCLGDPSGTEVTGEWLSEEDGDDHSNTELVH